MLPILACLIAVAAAAPTVYYDQRQEGEMNLDADIQNVVILVAIPKKMTDTLNVLEGLIKLKENGREAQERSDAQAMEAFVEPSTPYRVEIGAEGSERSAGEGGGRVEVVIAGRRRSDSEPAERAEPEHDELKLLGATEQCGPEYERDPATLTCRPRTRAAPEREPEVLLASP